MFSPFAEPSIICVEEVPLIIAPSFHLPSLRLRISPVSLGSSVTSCLNTHCSGNKVFAHSSQLRGFSSATLLFSITGCSFCSVVFSWPIGSGVVADWLGQQPVMNVKIRINQAKNKSIFCIKPLLVLLVLIFYCF